MIWTHLKVAVAAATAVAVCVAIPAAIASPATEPADITWDEAVALGLPVVKDFAQPKGMPECPPIDPKPAGLASDEDAPDDAPVCWQPPETQGLVFAFRDAQSGERHELTASAQTGDYRFGGAETTNTVFEGGKIRNEVSNPSVCHSSCAWEHFYSRVAAISSGGHGIEMGWEESNHAPSTGDDQVITSVEQCSTCVQDVAHHTAWTLTVGDTYSFRVLQCGPAGDAKVCMMFYDKGADVWRNLRTWNGVMSCEQNDGDGNCRINWYEEVYSADQSWFNINGGTDYLHSGTNQVEYHDAWDRFDTSYSGSWIGNGSADPYDICADSAHYAFRFLRGTC
jgi:hypothetical protein